MSASSVKLQPIGSLPEAPSGAKQVYLRAYRKRMGYTLQFVGERLGLHYSAVQKWEGGSSSPTARDLARLAEIYEVHPAALFLDPKRIDVVRIEALMTGVHPAALVLTGGDSDQLEVLAQLTRCQALIERLGLKWTGQWIKLAEMSAKLEAHASTSNAE